MADDTTNNELTGGNSGTPTVPPVAPGVKPGGSIGGGVQEGTAEATAEDLTLPENSDAISYNG